MKKVTVVWVDPNNSRNALCVGHVPIKVGRRTYFNKVSGFLTGDSAFKEGEEITLPKEMRFECMNDAFTIVPDKG